MNSKVITGITVAVIIIAGLIVTTMMRSNQQEGSGSTTHQMNGPSNADSSKKSSSPQETNTVTYQDFAVAQPHIKVKKGTTVTWVNQDTAKHDVTPVNETDSFKASDLFGKNESYTVTFDTVGKFEYFCSPHPYMKGVVEVVES